VVYRGLVSIGRRKVRLEDESSWVFNRMVEAYEARPAYPDALVDAVSKLARSGSRFLDVGAGLGHLAWPLAERGHRVTAVEPAVRMLKRLRERGNERIDCVHAMAEQLPFDDGVFDVAVVADVVHFLDSERAAREVARVLAPRGALAVVVAALSDTPFMRAVREIMEESAPRRPRETSSAVTELFAVARLTQTVSHVFEAAVPVDRATLEQILRSVSFIGPAMNPERWARFMERISDIDPAPVWSRTFTLSCGSR
jgi:ubiquinone/menaquinone biosynthesis C-methylase UbiE